MEDVAVLVTYHIYIVELARTVLLHLCLEEELQLVVGVEKIWVGVCVGEGEAEVLSVLAEVELGEVVELQVLVEPHDLGDYVAVVVHVARAYLHDILVVISLSVAVQYGAYGVVLDDCTHDLGVGERRQVYYLDLLLLLVVVNKLHESHLLLCSGDVAEVEPCLVYTVADSVDFLALVVVCNEGIAEIVHLCCHVYVCDDVRELAVVCELVSCDAPFAQFAELCHAVVGVRSGWHRNVEVVHESVILVV